MSVAVFADPVFERDDPRVGRAAARRAAGPATRGAIDDAVDTGREPGDRLSFPRLLASRDEAEAIVAAAPPGSAVAALGFDATRERATSADLARFRIVHFATHAMLDRHRPELSGIVLSMVDERGRARDGFLHLEDIYNLRLPAELVVLSACNTGLGKDVRGEGLVGLTRGFMYAGTARVVATAWRVDDEATAALMKAFYIRMFSGGLSPAAALREAQLEIAADRRWRSPYYWAAFMLVGEWRSG
jgi:CHAT domain-containing protein